MHDPEGNRAAQGLEAFLPADRAHRPYARRQWSEAATKAAGGRVQAARGWFGRFRRVLASVGLTKLQPRPPRADAPPASQRARLESIALRLEAILGELDDLGSQRTAIDVCVALERIRGQIADRD